jgi:hypothetical protein
MMQNAAKINYANFRVTSVLTNMPIDLMHNDDVTSRDAGGEFWT